MLTNNMILGYPKDTYFAGIEVKDTVMNNPFTVGDRPSHADKILVLPAGMLRELGVLEYYSTVEDFRDLIKTTLFCKSRYSRYWNNLLIDMEVNDPKESVAVVYGGSYADADFQILELINSKVNDLEIYKPHLDRCCFSWSVSVFSSLLSEIKLMYVCGGDEGFSNLINKVAMG